MKRLILNSLILAFFLVALSTIGVNTSLACLTVDGQFIAMADDPNEPQPEPQPEIILGSGKLIYLAEDPNEPAPEPQPEIGLYGLNLTYLAADPNEPQPE
jgi:hypothetical protein